MANSKFMAHSRDIGDTKEYQTIKEHATGVADMVVDFSKPWCEENFAKALSLLHDVGKYQSKFQRRIRGENVTVPHALCGAKEYSKFHLPDAAAYIIAGHHAGLYDREELRIKLEEATEDYSAYADEFDIPAVSDGEKPYKAAVSEKGEVAWKEYAFWIRMMFSCLVDADYLDTEAYCNAEKPERGIKADFNVCLNKLCAVLTSLQENAQTKTEVARKLLNEQVLSHVKDDADIYYMNMPTGSGKTLASMRFALERAISKNKKRIIYVIPYTSIIEQNASVFKDIFGNDCVLEHHCNFDYEAYTDEALRQKMCLATENWDAPFVITTNVQFFESIYSNKTSKLRKLHNIANSIIVFDEVHMLPNGFFQPCLEAIKILTLKYGCEAIFLTATMPDFDEWLSRFKCDGVKTCNLINDTSCFEALKRCRIENLGMVDEELILSKALEKNNALIVVNKRQTARRFFKKCNIKKYHLSTYMNHFDRERVIDAVKASIENGEHFCLFSTSLIEAGVDLDFDSVFREQAGLDNLLQTAGRCNRNGRKNTDACTVYSFALEEAVKSGINERYSAREAMSRFSDVSSPEAINFYFNKLYELESVTMERNDFSHAKPKNCNTEYWRQANMFRTERIYKSLEEKGITHFNFAGYAENFMLIDEYTHPLLIIDERNRDEIEALLNKLKFSASGRNERRKLQKYMISLRHYEWKQLQEAGVIQEREGIDCLANKNYYDKDIGICFEDSTDYIY